MEKSTAQMLQTQAAAVYGSETTFGNLECTIQPPLQIQFCQQTVLGMTININSDNNKSKSSISNNTIARNDNKTGQQLQQINHNSNSMETLTMAQKTVATINRSCAALNFFTYTYSKR
jgi:hypothetical protein